MRVSCRAAWAIPIVLRVLVTLGVLATMGCGRAPSPEDRIRALIAEAERAAEARDAGALVDLVTEDYGDARGNDRRTLRQLLFVLFRQNERVFVLHHVRAIDVAEDGTTATAQVAVAVAAQPIDAPADLSGVNADLLVIDIALRVEDDAWLVHHASWKPAALGDFL